MTHHWVPSGKNRLAVDLPSRPNGAVVTQAGHAANSAVPHTLRKQLGRTTSQTRTRASGFVDFGQEQLPGLEASLCSEAPDALGKN